MLPFSQFMSQSLYGENGYYTDSSKVSKAGDFYTSVSVSKFFGGAIASYILSLLESNALSLPLRIVEIGADKGYLLGDIALFLDALGEVLPQCEFIIIEPLSTLAQAQKAYLGGLKFSCVLDFKIVESFEALSQNKDSSLFVISNELFDSFPCDVLDSGKMLCVSRDSKCDSKWCGIWQNLCAKNLSTLLPRQSLEILDKLKCNPLEFRGLLPQWQDFICNLSRFAKAHKNSHFVSFDYGRENLSQTQNPNAKYYNPLHTSPRFYKSHQVLSLKDFLEQDGDFHTLYQNADITYDVDFTLLDSLLCENGFQKIFCDTQAKVLIEKMQILELLQTFSQQCGYNTYLKEIHKLKTLLHTLGERFLGICYIFSK